MGDYAVPESIRKMKPKGTMVKKLKNGYYVYNFENYTDEKGKRKTRSLGCIGKITADLGFVPNNSYLLKATKTCYEYGQYALAFAASKNVLTTLESVFNKQDAYRMYFHALLQVVNQYTGATKIETDFEQSYLSMNYPSISMTYYSVTSLLDDLGRKQTKVIEFEQTLIDEAEEIAVDGHVIRTESDDNDLSEAGYKFKELKAPQMNLLMGYDTKRKRPVFSRMFQGNSLDKVSFKELLDRYQYKDILFLIDRGFTDEKNFEIIDNYDCNYIIPSSQNLEDYKNITKDQKFNGRFIFETINKDKKKEGQIVYYKEIEYGGKRVFLFKNMTTNNKDQFSYLSNLAKYPETYSEEEFEEQKDWFGTVVLRTNLPKEKADADYVYCAYKRRWRIETFYNYLKNGMEFSGIQAEDYYKIQGLSFIVLISGLIHAELVNKVKLLKGYSVDNVLREFRALKLGFQNGHWAFFNESKKLYNMMKKIDFDCYKDLSKLNSKL